MILRNPVIPGFHPDPNVCRVGDDYYLVTSSFEYFPGVPIFHSRDLVNWRQIGHVLTRKSQLPLRKVPASGGIYAPSLRRHEGRFFMVTTNVNNETWKTRNFFVTAEDPTGPWSEPVWLDEGGIDPDILFDEDGIAYYMHTGKGAIVLGEVDVESGEVGPMRSVWAGAGGSHPEGPHLYRIEGTGAGPYYLMIAEGGTGRGHTETIARSESPYGPFEPCPHNPILTNRSREDLQVQCTGHADLVQAADGSWWLVFLAVRVLPGPFPRWHVTGRETFLAPVQWRDGWPMVAGGGPITPEMEAPDMVLQPFAQQPARDDFDASELRPCWNFLRNPHERDWSLDERPGSLTLHGSALTLSDVASPAFIGRRQQHLSFCAQAMLEFGPATPNEEAGLTVLMNDRHHYELAITQREGRRVATVRRRVGSLLGEATAVAVPEGPLVLGLAGDASDYRFSVAEPGGQPVAVGRGEVRYLSTEVAGGFTGVYVGMYATGNGQRCVGPAAFDWFEYEGALAAS